MIDPSSGLPTRYQNWALDPRGNWAGDATYAGLTDEFDPDGNNDPDTWTEIDHAVDLANSIDSVTTSVDGVPGTPQTYVYDPAGNLVWDGRLYYQYDGVNRLVQVNEAAAIDPATDFDPAGPTGRLLTTAPVGPKLAGFVYDGLGRLIKTYRADRQANDEEERHFYDGVRRIRTMGRDWLWYPIVRDYIWGPGYTDEIISRIDVSGPTTGTYYYLQDANYNVVALLDAAANVLLQYTYTPYGEAAAVDQHASLPIPENSLGHQGLFHERFCAVVGETVADATLTPTATAGVYHNRNRSYDPRLGRFLQRDPNESALPLLMALARNGEAIDILMGAFDPDAHYGDGLNLYEYLGSNPVNRLDPTGLGWNDMFDEIDDIIATINGEKAAAAAAAAAKITMALNTAKMIAYMAFSMMPGGDAVMLGVNLAMGADVGWDDVAYAGLSIGGAGIVAKFGAKFIRAIGGYAGKLGNRARGWLRANGGGLSGRFRGVCFVAGTL